MLQLLGKMYDNFDSLSKKRFDELWEEYLTTESKEIAEKLVLSMVGLVLKIAHNKVKRVMVPFEDLVQEGLMSIFTGLTAYNPERGYPSTFFNIRVTRDLRRYIHKYDRLIRLPAAFVDGTKKKPATYVEMQDCELMDHFTLVTKELRR